MIKNPTDYYFPWLTTFTPKYAQDCLELFMHNLQRIIINLQYYSSHRESNGKLRFQAFQCITYEVCSIQGFNYLGSCALPRPPQKKKTLLTFLNFYHPHTAKFTIPPIGKKYMRKLIAINFKIFRLYHTETKKL